jgi:CRISPR-associated endonuclease Csn1
VISTFEAYQLVRTHGLDRLRHPKLSVSGKPLVMRLIIDDFVRLRVEETIQTMRVASVNAAGRLSLAPLNEANVDARNRDPNGDFRYTYKQAGSLKTAEGRKITISPIGELHDPGFKE